jgi:hypothetical protein
MTNVFTSWHGVHDCPVAPTLDLQQGRYILGHQWHRCIVNNAFVYHCCGNACAKQVQASALHLRPHLGIGRGTVVVVFGESVSEDLVGLRLHVVFAVPRLATISGAFVVLTPQSFDVAGLDRPVAIFAEAKLDHSRLIV